MNTEIRAATWDDEPKIGALMALAFASDPFVRWILPDPQDYIRNSEAHVGRSSGPAFDRGTAFIFGDNLGASVWLPPRVKLQRDPEDQKDGPVGFPPEFGALIRKSAAYCPITPHWYLAFIVVDPAHHGRGVGSALMRHGLDMCDADGLPTYLESTNRANLTLYKRSGFELLAEVAVGASPPRFPMLRPAQ